jgi:dTDP-4-dehydrorhamnose 3,5-epimerase
MPQTLNWQAISTEHRPLRAANDEPSHNGAIRASQPDLASSPAAALEQMDVWTNAESVAGTISVVAGNRFLQLGTTGIVLVEPRVFSDHRGLFYETYHSEKYSHAGIPQTFLQDNHSLSHKNVLRGLHYQVNRSQGKLIRAIHGAVYDVAVDLRRNSPTFGRWFATLLCTASKRMIYIPPGFAHGFCTCSNHAEVAYKCTDLYSPVDERTLLWNDPAIAIRWPVVDPIITDKDKQGKTLAEADLFA